MPADAVTPLRVPGDPTTLLDGESLRFRVHVYGVSREAFVTRTGGELRAYLNTCRHQSRPLDMGDGQFFDDGDRVLVCRHHGARYEALSGRCVEGPCEGASLTSLCLERREDGVWCVDVAS